MTAPNPSLDPPRVVIAGAGFAGVSAARELCRRYQGDVEVFLVAPRNHMLFQPLLPEVASGAIEPRHAVAPLRRALPGVRFLLGKVDGLDPTRGVAMIQPPAGERYEMPYSHAVVALGSAPRALPIPGLDEHAVGFSRVAEALHLRNAVLSRLEIAESTADPAVREAALRAVFIGGGYTGVEAMAELHELACQVCGQLQTVNPGDLRWMLVEATDRILPNLPLELADQSVVTLRRRGIDVRLGTTVDKLDEGTVQLSTGEQFRADTVVWSAGVEPHPDVARMDLTLDDMGRIDVDRTLHAVGTGSVWAAGDCAAVPRPDGGTQPPTAEQATRQGRLLGRNVASVLKGNSPDVYEHAESAELVTLGGSTAIGTVAGRHMSGRMPWLARRAYYLTQMPSATRRIRLAVEWTLGAALPTDATQLDSLEHPGQPLHRAVKRAASS